MSCCHLYFKLLNLNRANFLLDSKLFAAVERGAKKVPEDEVRGPHPKELMKDEFYRSFRYFLPPFHQKNKAAKKPI